MVRRGGGGEGVPRGGGREGAPAYRVSRPFRSSRSCPQEEQMSFHSPRRTNVERQLHLGQKILTQLLTTADMRAS